MNSRGNLGVVQLAMAEEGSSAWLQAKGCVEGVLRSLQEGGKGPEHPWIIKFQKALAE